METLCETLHILVRYQPFNNSLQNPLIAVDTSFIILTNASGMTHEFKVLKTK